MQPILEVSVENFLSFKKSTLKLGSLNVLLGPNGAGKTNFLNIFQFLGDVARQDLTPAIDRLGGFRDVHFRGSVSGRETHISIRGLITEHASVRAPDQYSLSFWEMRVRARPILGQEPNDHETRRYVSREETIVLKRTQGRGRRITLKGNTAQVLPIRSSGSGNEAEKRSVSVQGQSSGLSTLRKLGEEYGASQVEALAQVFETLRLFEVDVESVRRPARSASPSHLAPNGSNVAHFLQWLAHSHTSVFEKLCDDVRFVLPSFEEFQFVRIGGADEAVRMDIKERHLTGSTPLARASYGTIRAIALFAMLHDPNPPRLTCLEEIDHGFHPHALDRLVERLREASARTQIIVATHSPALINRLEPAELIIFERDGENGATRILDLDPAQMAEMERVSGYRMGELWFSGALGGGLDQEG